MPQGARERPPKRESRPGQGGDLNIGIRQALNNTYPAVARKIGDSGRARQLSEPETLSSRRDWGG
jgi:hypothetical protein